MSLHVQWPLFLDNSAVICEQEQVPFIATATQLDSIRIVDQLLWQWMGAFVDTWHHSGELLCLLTESTIMT